MKAEFFYIHSINKSITTKGMNMTTAIEKLDELLATLRSRIIASKGLQENTTKTNKDPQHPDTDYLIKVFNHLKDLGYINTQYEFSERFLNKNKYYYGMILSEHRHPSIDALHYLIKSISELSEAETNNQRLDTLYEEGHSLITKRLLKNY